MTKTFNLSVTVECEEGTFALPEWHIADTLCARVTAFLYPIGMRVQGAAVTGVQQPFAPSFAEHSLSRQATKRDLHDILQALAGGPVRESLYSVPELRGAIRLHLRHLAGAGKLGMHALAEQTSAEAEGAEAARQLMASERAKERT
jgi:hypothetical protein